MELMTRPHVMAISPFIRGSESHAGTLYMHSRGSALGPAQLGTPREKVTVDRERCRPAALRPPRGVEETKLMTLLLLLLLTVLPSPPPTVSAPRLRGQHRHRGTWKTTSSGTLDKVS